MDVWLGGVVVGWLVDNVEGWFVWRVSGDMGKGLVGLLFSWLVR